MKKNGKNILITGATSGIGEATAKYLFQQGYNLILTGRNENRLEELEKELDCLIYPMDLAELERIPDLFDFCQSRSIKLDGLVHSAGIGGSNVVRTLEMQEVEHVMRVNYFSLVMLIKYYIRKRYSNDGGSIVALSSIASYTAEAGMAAYAGAKSAINSLIKVTANECLKRKIRANVVLPAMVDTPMTVGGDHYVMTNQPYGFIEKEQIAYLIEFLLSDKAKYITGTAIPVSGGLKF